MFLESMRVVVAGIETPDEVVWVLAFGDVLVEEVVEVESSSSGSSPQRVWLIVKAEVFYVVLSDLVSFPR